MSFQLTGFQYKIIIVSLQFISVQHFILFVYSIISFRIILFPVFDLAKLSESMRITKITSDKKYAKLDEDISFTIEYESPLTEEEIQTEWEVYVSMVLEKVMCSTHRTSFFEIREENAM